MIMHRRYENDLQAPSDSEVKKEIILKPNPDNEPTVAIVLRVWDRQYSETHFITPESQVEQTVFRIQEWEPREEVNAWIEKVSQRSGYTIHWCHDSSGINFYVRGRCDIEKISEAIKHFFPELHQKVYAHMEKTYSDHLAKPWPFLGTFFSTTNKATKQWWENCVPTIKTVDYCREEFLRTTPFEESKETMSPKI
jgi:hypothetical protein